MVQPVNGETAIRQRPKLVDVVFEELVREKPRRRLRRDLTGHRRGEQQRGRVDGGAEDRVDRKDVREVFDDFA
jgi:hypothetical protein